MLLILLQACYATKPLAGEKQARIEHDRGYRINIFDWSGSLLLEIGITVAFRANREPADLVSR
jgi:hypothetical protein